MEIFLLLISAFHLPSRFLKYAISTFLWCHLDDIKIETFSYKLSSKLIGQISKNSSPFSCTKILDSLKYILYKSINDKNHGQGTITYSNGNKYVGEFLKGKFHGQGTYSYANGDKYDGEWKNYKKHGQGTFIDANGNKYVGEWKKGNMHGQGTITTADGTVIKGIFKNDELVKQQ